MSRQIPTVLLLATLAAACSKSSSTVPAPGKSVATAAPLAVAKPRTPTEPKLVVKGTILEKLDAGDQSYLRLKTEAGDAWVKIPKTQRKVGEEVRLDDPLPLKDHDSKELGRKFDVVYFGNAI
jgi:hypothetical protein